MSWFQNFLFLICVIVYVVGAPQTTQSTSISRPDECKNGPQYWCQNMNSAKECQAVQHCYQTVWSKQIVDEVDDSSACKTCIDYISAIKEATTNNITTKQAEVVLQALCLLIPNGILSKECVLAVGVTVPELLEFIKNIDPKRFCCTIFLCNSATISKDYLKAKNIAIPSTETNALSTHKEVATKLAEHVPKNFECRNCYVLFSTGEKMFKKTSKDGVLQNMLHVCGELSSFSDFCHANVITYFDSIYKAMESVTVNEMCHLSGVCHDVYHFHETSPELLTAIASAPENANDEVCEFCMSMVNHFKDVVVANTTEIEFKQVLQGICKQTGSFQKECLQLVDQYYELVYQFLILELDPKELCTEVKLCPAKNVADNENKILPLLAIHPSNVDLDEVLKKETSDLHSVILSKSAEEFKRPLLVGANRCTWGPSYWCTNMTTSKECSGSLHHCINNVWTKMELEEDNDDICTICKDMVKQARDQLNSNETQEEIKEVFEGSCKLMPIKIVREECIKAVDEFVPELVETLSSQMNPQIVCSTVGLCNSKRMDMLLAQYKKDLASGNGDTKVSQLPIDRMFLKAVIDVRKPEVELNNKDACTICEMFLHFVQEKMTLPKSEEEIKKVIDEVCVKLPHDVASQCSQFVDVYGSAFIALLAQEIDPSTVCPRIGACLSYSIFDKAIDNVKPTCPLCLLAVKALEEKIGNNKTEASIVKALDTLCIDLPTDMRNDCDRLIKKAADHIVDSIMADFTPQETCLFLKFCDSKIADAALTIPVIISKQEIIETNEVDQPLQVNNNVCVLCEFIISKLDKELKDKRTKEEIKEVVDTICKHMPNSVSKECISFVDQYADMVIELLAVGLEPEHVCAALHVCPHPKDQLEDEKLYVIPEGISSDVDENKQHQMIRQQLYLIFMSICGFVMIIFGLALFVKTRRNIINKNAPYTRVN